jgi:hypothetical protein
VQSGRERPTVLLDVEASPEEVAAVERVVRSFGIGGRVEAGLHRKALGDLPFTVYVFMPVAAGFLGALGTDLYAGLKRFLTGIVEARNGRRGAVVIRDGAQLVLSSDLPDEALQALAELDPSELEDGYWVWDRDAHEWRNAF